MAVFEVKWHGQGHVDYLPGCSQAGLKETDEEVQRLKKGNLLLPDLKTDLRGWRVLSVTDMFDFHPFQDIATCSL